MSASIDSNAGLSGAMLAGTLRTQDKPARADSATEAGGTAAASDTLKLTGDAMQLHEMEQDMASTPAFDVRKVESLRRDIAEGRYEVDADRIASRMMSQDIELGR